MSRMLIDDFFCGRKLQRAGKANKRMALWVLKSLTAFRKLAKLKLGKLILFIKLSNAQCSFYIILFLARGIVHVIGMASVKPRRES